MIENATIQLLSEMFQWITLKNLKQRMQKKDRRFRQSGQLSQFLLVLPQFFLSLFCISREIERRRRIKAEEERRRQEMARIMALQDAQNEGMEVTMSVEERRRAELQENAIAMAKEHPEDVAMLIRTWLMEEQYKWQTKQNQKVIQSQFQNQEL